MRKLKGKEGNIEEGKNIFWNITGLKSKDEEWQFLKGHEVIYLIETWVELEEWEKMKKIMPKGWEWKCIGANKGNKKGRASGGVIVGIRKGIKEIGEMKIEKDWAIESKIVLGGKIWRVIRLHNRGGSVEKMQELERQVEEECLVIGGDFNARIERKGEIVWNEGKEEERERESRDEIENREGKELLRVVEGKGWIFLNGNKEGDYKGEWTFERGKHRSVIDHGIANIRALIG